jgi:hypothetical protein
LAGVIGMSDEPTALDRTGWGSAPVEVVVLRLVARPTRWAGPGRAVVEACGPRRRLGVGKRGRPWPQGGRSSVVAEERLTPGEVCKLIIGGGNRVEPPIELFGGAGPVEFVGLDDIVVGGVGVQLAGCPLSVGVGGAGSASKSAVGLTDAGESRRIVIWRGSVSALPPASRGISHLAGPFCFSADYRGGKVTLMIGS